MTAEDEILTYWLYVKLPDTVGWRLALNVPLKDVANAQAIATILKTQYDSERLFSVRADGKKNFRRLK